MMWFFYIVFVAVHFLLKRAGDTINSRLEHYLSTHGSNPPIIVKPSYANEHTRIQSNRNDYHAI